MSTTERLVRKSTPSAVAVTDTPLLNVAECVLITRPEFVVTTLVADSAEAAEFAARVSAPVEKMGFRSARALECAATLLLLAADDKG